MPPVADSMLNRCAKYIFIFFFALFLLGSKAAALEPEEVLVVANTHLKQSISLARFYMGKRDIPQKNMVLLSITDEETCSRKAYEKNAIPPIRKFLKKNKHIRAIVTMYGIPLRISAPRRLPSETERLKQYNIQKNALEDQLTGHEITDVSDRQKKHTELSNLKNTIAAYLKKLDKTASFDSELSLIKKEKYDLNMWLPNPYYLGFRNQKTGLTQDEVLMTSRLDASSPAIVKRIILDTLEAEKEGLIGKAYFDARWKDPGTKKLNGYALYDKSIHEASRQLSREKRMGVVLEDTSILFQKGDSPDTALYCGWYSLAKYIDAFTWQKGSVGYHIASAECTTLRKETSEVWCKKMLDNGIAATIGPVGEPYVQAFPMPEIFFNYLTEGYLTLAESYIISLPYLSWKMVLIGDPLYRLNLKSQSISLSKKSI